MTTNYGEIGVSILNTDLSNLSEESRLLVSEGVDFLHLDVMDGHFVEDISFGSSVISHLRSSIPDVFFDVHLMVDKPWQFVSKMAKAGADRFTFHYEVISLSDCSFNSLFEDIRLNGMKMGIALNPSTNVDNLIDLCVRTGITPDCFLVMTVVPGKGGQKLIPDCLEKVKRLRKVFGSKVNIEVDGGVNLDNTEMCVKAGANLIVSGTGIVGQLDRKATIEQMQAIVQQNFLQ